MVPLCLTLKFGAPICIIFGDTPSRGTSQARDELLRMSGPHQVFVSPERPAGLLREEHPDEQSEASEVSIGEWAVGLTLLGKLSPLSVLWFRADLDSWSVHVRAAPDSSSF